MNALKILEERGFIEQLTHPKEMYELFDRNESVPFYIGIDPTADSLHVGHFVSLMVASYLQKCGHKPIILVGGGTASIGDPSGKTDMRKMLSREQIDANVASIKKQVEKFVSFEGENAAIIVNNADWLLGLNYIDFMREIGSLFSINRMLAAECYKQRLETGLTFFELGYMLMQSYDFLHLYNTYGCKLEIGGNDQWSNIIGGVDLIRKIGRDDSYGLTFKLLTTKEGKKMGLLTFKGGLHPYDGKELSKDKPITEYLPQGELVYPLSQHIGAPAVACVKKGDRVLVGQKIAEAGGFVSANIYSSVSGTVKKIEPRMTVSGNKVNSIIVENDGEYETVSFQPVTEKTNEAIINAVKEAGIVGLGGAGFPTHVKLSPKEPEKIDTIIINAAECEPYITADYRCMMEIPEQLISGLNIMLSLFPKAKGVIGIEDNKPEAIAKLTELCKNESRIEVAALKTKYPQGAERSLIFAVTGRAINSSMLPADAGCIVDNVATAIAIHEAITLGKPLFERVVTVTGDAIKNPGNFKVKNGTNAAELVEAAGGFKSQPEKVISGGPMMGMALSTLDVPCAKTFSSLLCFTKDEVAACEPSNCIRCGRCISVCPAGLMPTKLSEIADHGDFALFDELNGCECVECGCCSYICPAKRRLTQSMKTGRREAMALRRKKK